MKGLKRVDDVISWETKEKKTITIPIGRIVVED